jgi:hypothetical protein
MKRNEGKKSNLVIPGCTPGPWINRTAGDPTPGSGGEIRAGKAIVATCHFGADAPDYLEFKNNARAVAVLPQLFVSLRDLCRLIEAGCSASTIQGGRTYKVAVSVIEDLTQEIKSYQGNNDEE